MPHLLILNDPDFTRGYHAGQRYNFFEGSNAERLTDAQLVEYINAWALEYHEWREPEQVFRFRLGCRIGKLSGELIPIGKPECRRVKEGDRRFMGEYKALRSAPMVALVCFDTCSAFRSCYFLCTLIPRCSREWSMSHSFTERIFTDAD